MKSITLKFSWRIRNASTQDLIKDFGEQTTILDFADQKLELTENNQIASTSIPALVTELKRFLASDVGSYLRTDPALKEAIHFISWRPDIYKLSVIKVAIT